MTAVPNGAGQKWHSDNRARGLTVIVPLVDFTASNGATQVLVGSHNKTWNLVAQRGAQVVEAPVGSLAVYDSRMYHRGLGNRTKEARVERFGIRAPTRQRVCLVVPSALRLTSTFGRRSQLLSSATTARRVRPRAAACWNRARTLLSPPSSTSCPQAGSLAPPLGRATQHKCSTCSCIWTVDCSYAL